MCREVRDSFQEATTPTLGLLPTLKLLMGPTQQIREALRGTLQSRGPQGGGTPAAARELGGSVWTHSQVCRTALHAPLLPNPKELAAPNLAGPCPTCLRPLSVDKEFKLPRKLATLAPAPTQGAP